MPGLQKTKFRSKDKKFIIYASGKTGTRSIHALIALTYFPDLQITKPYLFNDIVYPHQKRLNGFRQILKNQPDYDQKIPDKEYKIKVAVKRDPVQRIISAYKWCIKMHRIEKHTSFSTFINNIDSILPKIFEDRGYSDMFCPQIDYIGTTPLHYDYIFEIEDLEKLFQLFEKEYQTSYPRFTYRKDSSKNHVNITPDEEKLIKERYRKDYEIWFPNLI